MKDEVWHWLNSCLNAQFRRRAVFALMKEAWDTLCFKTKASLENVSMESAWNVKAFIQTCLCGASEPAAASPSRWRWPCQRWRWSADGWTGGFWRPLTLSERWWCSRTAWKREPLLFHSESGRGGKREDGGQRVTETMRNPEMKSSFSELLNQIKKLSVASANTATGHITIDVYRLVFTLLQVWMFNWMLRSSTKFWCQYKTSFTRQAKATQIRFLCLFYFRVHAPLTPVWASQFQYFHSPKNSIYASSIYGTNLDTYPTFSKVSAVSTFMSHFIWLLCHWCETCVVVLHKKKPDAVNVDVNNVWKLWLWTYERSLRSASDQNPTTLTSDYIQTDFFPVEAAVGAPQKAVAISRAFVLFASCGLFWFCNSTVSFHCWTNFKISFIIISVNCCVMSTFFCAWGLLCGHKPFTQKSDLNISMNSQAKKLNIYFRNKIWIEHQTLLCGCKDT